MNITKIRCKKCGYEWYYKRKNNGTTCSKCRSWVVIQKPANAGKGKRIRRQMSFEELFERPWYRSILYLTEKYGENGLRQLHYRWVLIKDNDGIKQSYLMNALTNFFNDPDKRDPLEFLYITKGCISSRSNLSNYLKRLVDKPYELLERTTRTGLGEYRLTEKGKHAFAKFVLLNLIKNAPAELLKEHYFEISKPIVEHAYFPFLRRDWSKERK
jgi:hypothetical protein